MPVTDVSWNGCKKFIKKLNGITKGKYRLPTEAEWEYACRAGTTTAYSYGDSLTKADANIDGNSTKEVGSYKPNAFGLYDMHGNVWEWCEDWYGRGYPEGAVIDPRGPATGFDRMLRGGSFDFNVSDARSFAGICGSPSNRDYFVGFRLAKTADIKTVTAPAAAPKPDPAKLKREEAKAKQMELIKLGIEKEMVLIPAGTFMMGSPESEKGRMDKETQHEVTLTKPFYMGKYEVTQEQWELMMGYNTSDTKGAKYPVTDVSWNDCQEFIKKLNKKTKGKYRLPTEAEWEYACRAGTTTAYSFGDNITSKDANYDRFDIGKPVAVGNYKPNDFGLYDMHGNVVEWCEDWNGDYPAGSVTDPRGPATGTSRVLRGGCFRYDESSARSSFRGGHAPTFRTYSSGFRLARTP